MISTSRTLLWSACLTLLATSVSAQTTWYVDASATAPGNGTLGSPYVSIQFALDQASTITGDTLSIAAGTYSDDNLQPYDKALTWIAPAGPLLTRITGGLVASPQSGVTTFDGLAFTTEPLFLSQTEVVMRNCRVLDVDGFGQAFSLVAQNTTLHLEDSIIAANSRGGIVAYSGSSVTLDKVTFAGNGPSASALDVQGGTLLAENCVFISNHLVDGSGGAISLFNTQATLRNSEFEDNTAYLTGRRGGAIHQFGGTSLIEDCTFLFNHSDQGGALALGGLSSASVTGTEFRGNVAVRDGSGMLPGQGGAVFVGFGASLSAEDCLFQINSAPASGLGTGAGDQLGGAVFVEGPGSTLRRCTFNDNHANLGGAVLHGPATLEQCVLLQNVNTQAGGTVEGGALLDRCTLVHNGPVAGSAAVLGSTVLSSIVWENAGGELGGGSTATYSCIKGGAPGLGNTAADPLFIDLPNEQVVLTVGSPCIDTASPAAPLDPDGTPADMGALPFTWQPIGASYCVANVNSSGSPAQMEVLGTNAVADDFLRLRASSTAVNKVGLFIMSRNQGFVPLFGGSQGNLCLSAPIVRLTNTPGSVGSSGAAGTLQLRLGLTTLPGNLAILPGQTWHFQSWFRDSVGGMTTSNTSDAVSVTFQ